MFKTGYKYGCNYLVHQTILRLKTAICLTNTKKNTKFSYKLNIKKTSYIKTLGSSLHTKRKR